MVDLPVLIHPPGVHPGVQQHLNEGDSLGEDEPDIHQLDIRGGGEGAGDADEQGGENKEGSQVNGHNSFKEKIFEKVCGIDNAEEKKGWKVNCQNCICDSPLKCYDQVDSRRRVACK